LTLDIELELGVDFCYHLQPVRIFLTLIFLLPFSSLRAFGGEAAEPQRKEIRQLLTLRPGQVSGTEAVALVVSLKADTSNAILEIEKLTASTNATERLLGFFLLLEIQGSSESILTRVADDGSPFVKAEIADWLYFKNRFPEWDSFLNKVIASLSTSTIEALFELLDSKPVRMELPAAMTILGLGRGLPYLTVEILRRSPDAVANARRQLQAPGVPLVRKENLLSLLHAANPMEYMRILEEIISASEDDSPLRWRAVWQYGQKGSGDTSVGFLSLLVDQHPQDRLAEELRDALTAVNNRTTNAMTPVSKLELRLQADTRLHRYEQDSASAKLVSYYVEMAKREHSFSPDLELLRSIQRTYATNATSDYLFRRMRADIDYLVWKTESK